MGSGELAREIDDALRHGWRHLELDLGKVPYISSAGLRVLQNTAVSVRPLQGSVQITKAQDFARGIIEVVGLYELLSPSVRFEPETPPGRTLERKGLKLEIFDADPNGRLTGCSFGKVCDENGQAAIPPTGRQLNFPATSFSLGIGALGRDFSDCLPRLGTFLAAGGMATYRSGEPGQIPDYLVYAEGCRPALFASGALEARGNFSRVVCFEGPNQTAAGLGELAEVIGEISGGPLTGFVMAAEFESLSGCALSLTANDNGRPIPAASQEDGAALFCGFYAAPGASAFWNGTVPPSPGSSLHAHAAVFAYQPLRMGFVKLPDAVSRLFEQPLKDVLHADSRSRLQRGVVWCSPLSGGIQ